jgi:hypothetical protein
MTMRWQMEAMSHWSYPETENRRGNPFRAKFDQTLTLLDEELEHLGVSGAVAVRVVGDANDVRRDGMMRARAQVRHPGVVLSFMAESGPLTFPCDTFAGRYLGDVDWQINLRAIALGLEALRKLDRYGIAGRGEQYVGWRAIEAPRTEHDDLNTPEGALRFLRTLVDESLRDGSTQRLWRAASKRTHPDANNGERGIWEAVQRAGITLGVTGGV